MDRHAEIYDQQIPEASPLIRNEDLLESVQGETRELRPPNYADVLSTFGVIAVLGSTGAGKSTFIQRVTGSDKIVMRNTLRSCECHVPLWFT